VWQPDPVIASPSRVAFYFDPMCPWAYRASRWIREVRDRTGVEVEWRFFSLEEVNLEEGKRHPWERDWSYGWSQMRIAASLRRMDPELVDRWYLATGDAFFNRGEPTFTREGATAVVEAMGLDRSVVDDALADPTTTEEVRSEHQQLVSQHGGHGVPTLVFEDGSAFFGPVVLTPPTGDAAVRLWDLVVGWTEFPDLYELRRPKTEADMRAIGQSFATYVTARKWRTVANPAR
jgi:predicted DsbA family dithiol-disulfide isomerase